MSDHVHMLIAIPPKHAVSQVFGFIKGKSAIYLARVYAERKRNYSATTFGPADTSSPPLGGTRSGFGPTSAIRNRRTSDWTRCAWNTDGHRIGGPNESGPR